ncbi:MAG: hypothetical protein ACLFSY_03900 [Desulfonatronovibrionaceae bacterium]
MNRHRRIFLKALAMGLGAGCLAPAAALANRNSFDLALEGQDLLSRGKTDREDAEAAHNLAKVYNDMAHARYESGDMGGAIELWQKTLEYEPGNKAAKYYLRKIE